MNRLEYLYERERELEIKLHDVQMEIKEKLKKGTEDD